MINELGKSIVANAIHNCYDNSGATDEYCRGIIVGTVSGLMANGLSFDTALDLVKRKMPIHNRGDLLPSSW